MAIYFQKLPFLIFIFYILLFIPVTSLAGKYSDADGAENKAPRATSQGTSSRSPWKVSFYGCEALHAKKIFSATTRILRGIRADMPAVSAARSTRFNFTSVIKIQSRFRSYSDTKKFRSIRQAIIAFQSNLRGKIARMKINSLRKIKEKKRKSIFSVASWMCDLPQRRHDKFQEGSSFYQLVLGGKKPSILLCVAKWKAASEASIRVPIAVLNANMKRVKKLLAATLAEKDHAPAAYLQKLEQLKQAKMYNRRYSSSLGVTLYDEQRRLLSVRKSLKRQLKTIKNQDKAARFRNKKLFMEELKKRGDLIVMDTMGKSDKQSVASTNWHILSLKARHRAILKEEIHPYYHAIGDLKEQIEAVSYDIKMAARKLKLLTPYMAAATTADDALYLGGKVTPMMSDNLRKARKRKIKSTLSLASWMCDLPKKMHEKLQKDSRFHQLVLGEEHPPVLLCVAKWKTASEASIRVPIAVLNANMKKVKKLLAAALAEKDRTSATYLQKLEQLKQAKIYNRKRSFSLARYLYARHHYLVTIRKNLSEKLQHFETPEKTEKPYSFHVIAGLREQIEAVSYDIKMVSWKLKLLTPYMITGITADDALHLGR